MRRPEAGEHIRELKQGNRKDYRNYTRCVNFERNMCILATVHFVTYNPFSVLYRNLPDRLLNVDNTNNDQNTYKHDCNRLHHVHEGLTFHDELGFGNRLDLRRNPCNDPGKDNQ
ncbi:hypothetical protein D3C76_1516520 [compost metagenome]